MSEVVKAVCAYLENCPEKESIPRVVVEDWIRELGEEEQERLTTAEEIAIMIEHQMWRGNWTIQSPDVVMTKLVDMIRKGLYKGKK